MSTPRGYEVAIEVPQQPRSGAVALDRYGLAWQRAGAAWARAGAAYTFAVGDGAVQEWADLLVHRGPVRVIWVPDPEQS